MTELTPEVRGLLVAIQDALTLPLSDLSQDAAVLAERDLWRDRARTVNLFVELVKCELQDHATAASELRARVQQEPAAYPVNSVWARKRAVAVRHA